VHGMIDSLEAETAQTVIDKEMLTVALKSGGRLREAQVDDLHSAPIGQGQGLTAALLRVEPTYSTYESNAPRSIIVKMSSGEGPAQDIARSLRFMERECNAYANIRRMGALRRPACYHYSLDRALGDGILFLEDLGKLTPGDQIAGTDDGQTSAALKALSSFHAASWEDQTIGQSTHLPQFNDPAIVAIVQQLYETARQPFDQNFGRKLPQDFLTILDDVAKNMGNLADRLAEPPVTVLHGDFRADNLFFDHRDDTPTIWAIDWQISCIGRAVFDAAYFISQSVPLRASHFTERTMLEAYHAALSANGVTGYDFDQCHLDYRRSVIYGLVYVVIACGFLGDGDKRSALLCETLLERTIPLARAHHGTDLL
jgi:aminoglycoside/choline kinase family phosphotransferase